MKYFFDTNILSYLFKKQSNFINKFFDLSAKIYADLKQKGNLIEDDDIFIGATTLENDAILVTNNAKHLGRIDGLKVEI